MADILPFKATRYSASLTGELSKLLTPPYDVISPAMQDDFYKKHERNLCRIDFGKELPGDNETENKYSRSGKLWKDWNSDGTMAADARPAFYVYEQEFDLPGRGRTRRRGFFSAVKLEDFSEGGIRAHEHTFAGPKADRLNLMRTTHCNMSPIFCIYDDPSRAADGILAKATEGKSPVTAEIDGIIHRLWIVDDAATVEAATKAMQPHRLYIADGHHRYETSLNYRAEMRAKNPNAASPAPFDATLMFLANTHDEGLEILPTHRVLSKRACENVDYSAALNTLSKSFEITPLETNNADALVARLDAAGHKALSFVMIIPGRSPQLLTLKAGANFDALVPDSNIPSAVKALDVTLLHRHIIHRALLGSPDQELDDADVSYVKDAGEAVAMALSGSHGAGFLLNPTKIEQVIEIAGLGMRMPHKSTFFYPKIITGMVIRDMNRQ